MLHSISSTVLCAAAAVAMAAPAAAQQIDDRRADSLHAAAVELHQYPDRLVEAARLHQQGAALRAPEDPRAVNCLALAGHLLYYAKRPGEARKVMEEAADRARNRGDVAVAAQIYVYAALIANSDHNAREAVRLIQQAEVLSASPLLAASDRKNIEARIGRVRIGPR